MARETLKLKPQDNEDANTQEVENDAIDNDGGQEEIRTGQVSEGDDDFIERVAKQAGWTDKESWTRDPAKHVDARTFLSRTAEEAAKLKARNADLEERSKRTAQAAADAMEEHRRLARQEALAELRAAAKQDDAEGIRKAEQKIEANTIRPETAEWLSRNTWFNTDGDARAIATEHVNRLAGQGASIRDQLQAAEDAVKRRFPEHFGEQPRTEIPARTEIRLSEVRTPPTVREGARGNTSPPKEKGWNEIPPADRALMMAKTWKHFKATGMKEADFQERTAKSYWKNTQ